jgi:hypothetical protein
MDKPKEFRKNADTCTEIARAEENGPKKKRFERLAEGWRDLANQQAWLDGECHSERDPKGHSANSEGTGGG